ncbi:phage tail tape measure protein [Spirosoma agri]|uniref:Phage tail tape measure protein n=1 Tax=Spirosoma agri TaxID=1987381 RepID=A0A6M0IH79_9BACT|nr:phage tail tape measure protein [Spirosoma agri]NEU67055.1 phage tail tape measure protein [Spirosoma agri]
MQLKEEALFTLKFDGKPVINELGELEKRLIDLKEAQKNVERGTKEWAQSKADIKELEASIKLVREEMGVSGMTVRQLENYYRQLNREIKELTPGTDEYIKKAAEMQEVNTALATHRQTVRGVNEEIEKQPTLWEKAKATATGFLAAFGATELLQRAFGFVQDGIQKALALSDMMAGVAKATGQSTEEVQQLSEALDNIDTRSSKESLMDIAQIGGQLGIANNELLGFIKSVDMANVALGDEFAGGAEEVSSKLGGLQKLFKETKDLEAGEAINQIGSAINELGAAGSATGPVIADFTSRMGQLGDLSPQIHETMGLGAAFQELGLTAEISAGGLSNILLGAAKATGLFSQQLNMSEDAFIQLIDTNPNEFLLKLAESLKNVPADQLAKRLDDLGIKSQEATKVMSLLKDQTDMVRQKQELAAVAMSGVYNVALEKVTNSTDLFARKLGISQDELTKMIQSNPNEFFIRLANSFKGLSETQIAEEMKKLGFESKEATQFVTELSKATNRQQQEQLLASPTIKQAISLHKEFSTVNSNAAAEYAKSQKALALIATEIGQALLPAITKGAQGLVAFVNIIRAVPEFLSDNKTSFAALGLAILAFNGHLVVATATSIGHAAAEKARLVWTNSATAAQWLLNTAMTANPIGAVVAVIALLVAGLTAIYNNSTTVRGMLSGLWEMFKTGNGIMVDLLDKFLNWIQKGLEPLRPILETVKNTLSSVWSVIDYGIDKWDELTSAVSGFINTSLVKISSALEPVRSALTSFGHVIDSTVTKIKSVGSAISSFLHVDELVSKVKSVASQIGDAFNKGYGDKLAEDQPKQVANHQQTLDKKKTAEVKTAKELTSLISDEEQNKIDKKAAQNDKHRESEAKKTAEAAKKEAEEAVKATNEGLKKMEELRIAAIKDDLEREVAKIRSKRDAEAEAIMASKASQSIKAVWETALNEQMLRDIEKANTEHNKKKEKEDAETSKRIYDLKIKLSGDEKAAKLQKLEDVASAQRIQIQKDITDETQKATMLKQISDNLIKGKELVEQEYRRKKQQEENTLQDQLYQATVADAGNRLTLAGNNAQAIYDAKKMRLDAEYEYNKAKLAREAAEQKAHNDANIADTDRRAAANKATDDKLKSDLSANDQKYENDKTQLTKEKTEARRQNQQEYFTAIKALMDGDFKVFTDILTKKLSDEKKQLTESQQQQINTIDEVGQYTVLAVQALQKLSQVKLDKELANIKKEKDSQLAAWKEKYDKGVISKDEYEKNVERINKEADGKIKVAQLEAFKRQQKLDIAMAVINGAQAALKSLATLGWPLGLIAVAGAAITTGIQIAMIKNQQPPSLAKGGKIRNAGVPDGPGHGRSYGDSGLSITRRDTGQEVAEMEGGEPIMVLSRNTYANNRQVVDSLLHSSLHRNGAPIMKQGGLFGSDGGSYADSLRKGGLRQFLDGGWMNDINEMDNGAGSGSSGDTGNTYDSGGSGSSDYGSASDIDATTQAQIEKSQATMDNIQKNTLATVEALDKVNYTLGYVQQQMRSESDGQKAALATNITGLRTDLNEQFFDLKNTIKEGLTALQGTMKVELPSLGTELVNEIINLRTSIGLNLLALKFGITQDVTKLELTTKTGLDQLIKTSHDDLTKLQTAQKTDLTTLQKGIHDDMTSLQKLLHDDVEFLGSTLHDDLGLLDTNVDQNLLALAKAIHDDLNSLKLAQAQQASTLRTDTNTNFSNLQATLETELDNLQNATHSDLSNLTESNKAELQSIQGVLNATKSEQGYQSGLLGRIASKDLSVSVQTFVNVSNQINVVADKSDLK